MRQVLFLVVLSFTAPVVLAACDDETAIPGLRTASEPAEVVEGYVTAYNAQDIDLAMAFFADSAVIIQGSDRIEGAAEIRTEILGEFEVHAPGGDAYSISNLLVAGNTVTWDHRFKGVAHDCRGTGNEAAVEDGQIVTWTVAFIECD